MHTQALAIFAARDFQGQRQQHLLTQDVFQQNSVALIIADFGLRVGHRKLIAARVRPEGPVEQLKLTCDVLGDRLNAPGAIQFQSRREPSPQPYVLNYLMLAVMLFDNLGMPGCLQRRTLPGFASQINSIGLKLLLKIQRMTFQFMNVQEHCETSAPMLPTSSAEARQEA